MLLLNIGLIYQDAANSVSEVAKAQRKRTYRKTKTKLELTERKTGTYLALRKAVVCVSLGLSEPYSSALKGSHSCQILSLSLSLCVSLSLGLWHTNTRRQY